MLKKKSRSLLELKKLKISKLTNPMSIIGGTNPNRRSQGGQLCEEWTDPLD